MFESKIQGIPCQIDVVVYHSELPSSGFFPPEPEEFEYEVYDRKGYRAKWLEEKITKEDEWNVYADAMKWRKNHD